MQSQLLKVDSVMEVESPWKEKATGSILVKIIKLFQEGAAIIIKDDCHRPLRFLYLALFMSKKNHKNMQVLLNKLEEILIQKESLNFTNMTADMQRLVGNSLQIIYQQLNQLNKKMQNNGYAQNTILKLAHQFALVDPLLILALRAIAEENRMAQALDCKGCLTFPQVEMLRQKFQVDKSMINSHNKFTVYWFFSDIEYEFFKKRGVAVLKQSECYQELNDSKTIKFEEFIMIEKVFSLL